MQGLFAHSQWNGEKEMDLLYEAAAVWRDLLPYRYDILCGKSKRLYPLALTFEAREFYHLAGFPHMKDIVFPVRFSQAKAMEKVLSGVLTEELICKSSQYEQVIKPKLQAILCLKELLNCCNGAYLFAPARLPFYTDIRASYLLADEQTRVVFLFTDTADSGKSFFARSAFVMGDRDYRRNQTRLTVLQIDRTDQRTGVQETTYRREGFCRPN